jgi:Tol biopolymer transport system component
MLGKSQLVPNTEFREVNGRFSPNGEWITYQSDETGPNEIYVRRVVHSSSGEVSFGGKWKVSRDGGNVFPRWGGRRPRATLPASIPVDRRRDQ